LLERIPGHETQNNQQNVEKIYSRNSRIREMSELYNIIIFNEVEEAEKYFTSINTLLLNKNRPNAYSQLKEKFEEI
jgi:hypothetical protein